MESDEAVANKKKIVNPYLAVNTRRRPLPLPESFELTGDDEETEAPKGMDETEIKKTVEVENQDSVLEEHKEGHDSILSGPPNTGIAYWERLPSKTLSFGSAEILTVEECLRHCTLYQGRAVRVTGQLLQRGFVGDDVTTPRQVLLELVHIVTTHPTPGNKTPAKLCTPTTPSKSLSANKLSSQKIPLKTPTLGLRKHLGSMDKASPPSSRRKRPWFATTNSSKRKTPLKRVVTPPALLKVLADPELPNLSEITPSWATKVTVFGTMQANGSIQARLVVLVDPTLDINLYVTALLRRRRCLYQRHKRLQDQQQQVEPREQSPDEPAAKVMLIQGCGPPPYDILLDDYLGRV